MPRKEFFLPVAEGEGRVLLLIDAFSSGSGALEGRTKLAKLDFFLRYPRYFKRALGIRAPGEGWPSGVSIRDDIEGRMIRYKYGPWDPEYYRLLGRLLGRGLIRPVPTQRGIAFRSSETGQKLAKTLAEHECWREAALMIALLKKHFNLSGTALKEFVYRVFPEVTSASMGERL